MSFLIEGNNFLLPIKLSGYNNISKDISRSIGNFIKEIILSSIKRYWLGVYESRKRGRRRLSKGRSLNSLSKPGEISPLWTIDNFIIIPSHLKETISLIEESQQLSITY